MKRLTILLLATALACHAQTSPTIKGHRLGESIQQFTANADDITRGLISTCVTKSRAYPALKAAADAAAAALAPYEAATPDLRDAYYAAYVAASGAAADADPSRETGCPEYMTIVNTGSGQLTCMDPARNLGGCRNFEGTVMFNAGKLVEIDVFVYAPWEDLFRETVAKFGKPTKQYTSTMQNGYGAKFDTQNASWSTPTYEAGLYELLEADLTRHLMLLLVDHDHYISQHKHKSNSLD